MKANLKPTLDSTPDVKRVGVEVGVTNVILSFTTVTNAKVEIEMDHAEWIQLRRDVEALKG